jgi:hypothetical protein
VAQVGTDGTCVLYCSADICRRDEANNAADNVLIRWRK